MRLFALVLIAGMFAGCASLLAPASVSPNAAPETTQPSPSASEVEFDCPTGPVMGPSPQPDFAEACSALEGAVEVAISPIGFKPVSISISLLGIPCHDPFRVHTVGCGWYGGAAAYVTFAATDDVAALDFPSPTGQAAPARLIAFEVPPAGWTIPRWSIP